jgi:hypothetical protein
MFHSARLPLRAPRDLARARTELRWPQLGGFNWAWDQDGQLTDINVHVNHSIGDVYIVDNGALSSLTLDVPGASSLDVERNPLLPTCQVQAIAQQLFISDATIAGNDDSASCAP